MSEAPTSRTGRPALVLMIALAGVPAIALAPGGTGADPGASPPPARDTAGGPAAPLTEPGNTAFAAVAEVVRELNARPGTDWSRVDLEALRRHLRDMERFTLGAEVVERTSVPGGLRVAVTGTDTASTRAVRRALTAHAPMLEEETGWEASVEPDGKRTVLTVTAERAADVARIRGLGYIGLMATGAHHTRHHWMIATGRHPHAGG